MEQGYQAMGTQQFDQAEQQFTEALRLRPNDADALMWLQNAREGKQKAEAQAKRDYETANGKYPADSPGLSAGVILPTDEQKAADAAAAAGDTTVGPGGGTPGASYPGGGGDSAHPYSWTGPGGKSSAPAAGPGFPSPVTEGPDYTPEPTPTQPQPQPQPQTVTPQPQPQYQPQVTPGATGTGDGAPQTQKGYLRITVGQRAKPKPAASGGGEVSGPSAESVRAQADALRRAGRGGDARKLYQQAIDLYDSEGQADPQARASKQMGADYCRRALEQSK
jgi:hypothetical protein